MSDASRPPLEADPQDLLKRLRTLAGLNRLISGSLELPDVLARIVRAAAALTDAQAVTCWLADERGRVLELEAAWMDPGISPFPITFVDFERGGGAGWVARHRRPLNVADISSDGRFIAIDWWRAHSLRSFLGFPLVREGSLLAVLALSRHAPFASGQEEDEILQIFVAQAATAIRNAQLYGEARGQSHDAEALAQMGRLLTGTLDPAVVGQEVVASVSALLEAGSAALYLLDEPSDALALHSVFVRAPQSAWPPVMQAGMGVSGLVVRDRAPVVVTDSLTDPRISYPPDVREQIGRIPGRALLSAPLLDQGRALGVLHVADTIGRQFEAREANLVEAFAQQAALALRNASLYEEADRRRHEAEVLAEIARSINASLDLDTILQRAVEGARGLTRSDIARIALRDPALGAFRFRYWANTRFEGYERARLRPGTESLGGIVLMTGRPARTDDWMADSRFSKETAFVVEAEGITSQMAVPIRIGDQIEGLLCVDNRVPRPFTDVDEGALVRLAEHASIAIRNAQLVADRGRAEAALSERDVQLRHAQKVEAVGRLAGGIAHDFNNLLMIIRGRSELTLRRGSLDPVTRQTLTLIDQASQAAAALIRRLLAFSQRQVLQPTILDLNEVVTSIERMLRALLREDVQLVLDLAQDLSPILADASMIEQIIMNLAVNAQYAMPKGGRLIIRTMDVLLDDAFVRANPDGRAGPHVCLEVQDTGIGMDAETQARIFEPFFTTKGSGKGTGLGLATVYGIVKQHQGSIRVNSRLGEGTTFTVYLPRAEGEAVVRFEQPGPVTEIPGGKETVLLVEDDASVRQLAQDLLESYGYRVLSASDGPRALAIAEERAEPIHLLVTDVIMPEMSGPDLAQRLLTVRPGMRVLYISGYADEALGPHEIPRPGTALLDKPFTLEAFLRKVRQILDPAKSAPPIEPPPPPVS